MIWFWRQVPDQWSAVDVGFCRWLVLPCCLCPRQCWSRTWSNIIERAWTAAAYFLMKTHKAVKCKVECTAFYRSISPGDQQNWQIDEQWLTGDDWTDNQLLISTRTIGHPVRNSLWRQCACRSVEIFTRAFSPSSSIFGLVISVSIYGYLRDLIVENWLSRSYEWNRRWWWLTKYLMIVCLIVQEQYVRMVVTQGDSSCSPDW